MGKKKKSSQSEEHVSGVLGLMERVNDFVKKNGIRATLNSLLILFIASVLAFAIFNPGIVYQSFQNYVKEKHEEGIKQRLVADTQVRSLLTQFRVELNADRAYILEAHNGGTNLTNLPFLYADLTYMDPRGTYEYIEYEYKNFRLSRYPWVSNVIENGFWFGAIEDCEESDPELYYRLQKENVKYMGMYVMYGNNGLPSACLGVIFKEGDTIPSIHQVLKEIQKYSNLIIPYLIGKE